MGGRRKLAHGTVLRLADPDAGHGMDRLARLGDRLREVPADYALHELADRLLRCDVGHDLRHNRPDHALLRRLDPSVRNPHRLPPGLPPLPSDHPDPEIPWGCLPP